MNGILLLDKPSGWTSNDVVQKLRGALRERRIGHAGTLDPMATGLLTVFVGRATRAVEFAEGDEKTYIAGLHLGVVTDTQDVTGTVISSVPDVHITAEDLEAALRPFRGTVLQTPPMYSAIRINGQRLYDLARQGKTVERRPREITVHELSILDGAGSDWSLLVRCSKGTYVRTLCHDIGNLLACGGCMSSLRRTRAGCFSLEDAVSLETVLRFVQEGKAEALLLPVDRLFEGDPAVTVLSAADRKLRNGNAVPLSDVALPAVSVLPGHLPVFAGSLQTSAPGSDCTACRVYSESGEFLALGRIAEGKLQPVKSFFEV